MNRRRDHRWVVRAQCRFNDPRPASFFSLTSLHSTNLISDFINPGHTYSISACRPLTQCSLCIWAPGLLIAFSLATSECTEQACVEGPLRRQDASAPISTAVLWRFPVHSVVAAMEPQPGVEAGTIPIWCPPTGPVYLDSSCCKLLRHADSGRRVHRHVSPQSRCYIAHTWRTSFAPPLPLQDGRMPSPLFPNTLDITRSSHHIFESTFEVTTQTVERCVATYAAS